MAYLYGIPYAKDGAKDSDEAEEDMHMDMDVITNMTAYDRLTQWRIRDWLVAKRRAQDLIDMLKTWGPTISPLSSIVTRQLELYKKEPKNKSAKQSKERQDTRGKSTKNNKGQQIKKRRPQRGVYVQFNGTVIYGYHNEAACHIGGGPDLESLTCCCWS